MPSRAKLQRTAARAVPSFAPTVESEFDEEIALWRRLEELREGNRYQRDFHAFLTECVWTVDEAAGGEFALFPDDEYVLELCDILMEEALSLLEKTRRVRVTWLCSALETWICAGGQDPRWPALMKGTGHRQCIIISKKEEDADFVIDRRIRVIYEQLWAHDIGSKWPGFPTCKFSYTEANWSNGSQIKALPQGPDQVRQYGATCLRYEEIAHSPQAQDTVATALPLLQGKDGSGGHIIGVCTPNALSYAREIRDDVPESEAVFGGPNVAGVDWPALRTSQDPAHRRYVDLTLKHLRAPRTGRLLPTWRTRSGWCVVQVPWLAVPGYDIKAAMTGQTTESGKRREYTLDWDASTGKLVLPDFAPHIHVAEHDPQFCPDEPLYVGLDMPGCPAAVIGQLVEGQLRILSSLQPEEDESIGVWAFGKRLADHLMKCYALPSEMELRDLQLLFFGDPAGNRPPARAGEAVPETEEARACFEVLERGVRMPVGRDPLGEVVYKEMPGWGWRVMSGAVGITTRLEALRARLGTLVNGEPALLVYRTAPALIKALSSYEYKELPDGQYSPFPRKNWPSHGVDALAYLVTGLDTAPPKKREQDKPTRREWRSGAQTRTRR